MGIDIGRQRSRKLEPKDFEQFDYIVAMDRSNLRDINARKPFQTGSDISLMLDELVTNGQDVPDPYYGGSDGFNHVWNLVPKRLLSKIINQIYSQQDYERYSKLTNYNLCFKMNSFRTIWC